MATELELKLMVQPEHLASVGRYLNDYCAASAEPKDAHQATLDLMNGYYDTAEAKLMRNGIALRIRAVNREYIQTVKTRGSSRVGMHARDEWEWSLPSDALDLSLLKEVPLPELLVDMAWSRDLIEVFRTDFKRDVWLIHYQGACIEVVADQGEVSSQYGRDGICEVELELKQGPEGALYAFATLMAEQVPMQVSTVSKAQKGSRLQHRKIEFPDKPKAHAELTRFAEYWYETWLVYWEAMFYLHDEALLQPVRSAVKQLRQCVAAELASELQSLEQFYDEQLHQDSDDDLLARLASSPQTGLAMLAVGEWLNQQLN
ncbi:CYTH domain-containing protein [Marinomonas ostreistagni]|uniref:CYTH domain-containing protein n=1 Tax=Marinomonas ostreistagni TaxID=359209 RepID=UPI0019528604|nr:CYTH domain-containing protein [Marinomonas ostreistagni]MBM6551405.1 CYTH domain-containing protein [Marinomonas ostreistagni]